MIEKTGRYSMVTLDELGFVKGSPAETIIATYSSVKEPHASAVGVWKKSKNKIFFRLFTKTSSFTNLSKSNFGSINIVGDAEKIAKAGLPEVFNRSDLNFEPSYNVDAPYVSSALAFVEFEVDRISKQVVSDEIGTSEMAEVVGDVKNIQILDNKIRSFSRAGFFLVESAVCASRAIEAIKNGNKTKAKSLLEEIKFYKDKCEDVAPDTSELRYISEILNYFNEKAF